MTAVTDPPDTLNRVSDTATRRPSPLAGLGLVGGLCLALLVLFALLAIFGPMLTPHDPNQVDLSRAYWGPDASHWLGYDAQGRDIASRLLVGARSSFLGPLSIVLIAVTLGLVIAVFSAWWGGWADAVIAGILDASMSFPGLLLTIMVIAIAGTGLLSAVIALGVAYIPFVTRVIRSAVLAEVAKDYTDALSVQGFSGIHICLRHLLPNVLPITIGQAAMVLAWATVDLAGLSYLGLGVQPPAADWGVMVSDGQAGVLAGYPLETIAAGTCLVVAICSFSLLGNRVLSRAKEVTA